MVIVDNQNLLIYPFPHLIFATTFLKKALQILIRAGNPLLKTEVMAFCLSEALPVKSHRNKEHLRQLGLIKI